MTGKILLAATIFWPMLAAVLAYAAGRKNERAGDVFALAAVSLTFILNLLSASFFSGTELCLVDKSGLALLFRLDGFRALLGCVTGFLWLVTTLFSPEYFARSQSKNSYRLFNLLTLGAAMGVFLSADFRTTFLFFEVASFTSYALVAHDESAAALRAAETYLAVAVIGGLALLMGMLLLQQQVGTLEFVELKKICSGLRDKSELYLPGALMLAGFCAKAGMFPLHIWLPKAHSVAPAPASALLSGIIIKIGVFGVVVVSVDIFQNDYMWGVVLLIPAVVTMVWGGLLGVLSNDLKRTLACSSVSQIGFILFGVAMQVLLGEHNAPAVRGVLLHMLNHSLFKLILFTAAGVVYMNRHETELDKIRGFGRGKPLFMFVFLMAAPGICGVPLWSGYISKTLLHKSLADCINLYHGHPLELPLRLSYWGFVFTGALTVAYMTKLFVTLFFERGETTKEESRYVSRLSATALAASAALAPLMGCFPAIMNLLAGWGQGFFNCYAPDKAMSYFAWKNLEGAWTSIAVGVSIYFLVVRGLLMRRNEGGAKVHAALRLEWLDLENVVYRPLLKFLTLSAVLVARAVASLPDALVRLLLCTVLRVSRTPYSPGRFLTRHYWVFHKQPQSLHEEPAVAGCFSWDLLLVGVGICVALLYVFGQAL